MTPDEMNKWADEYGKIIGGLRIELERLEQVAKTRVAAKQ